MRLSYLRFYIIFIFVAFQAYDAQSQVRYLQASAHIGTIIKHNSTITFDSQLPAFGLDLTMYWQTRGNKPWQAAQKFPRFYFKSRFHQLGDRDLVGAAFGLSGGVEVNMFRKKDSALHFGIGTGYAYLTRPFDRNTNPLNNAIGSHLNNSITVKFDYEKRMGQKWMLHLGAQLVHYSNGARKLPNLGLNIPALSIGISPYRGAYDEDFFEQEKIRSHKTKQQFGVGLYTQYAQVEIRVPGGPDYPVYIFGGDIFYYLNVNHRLSLGYQYDYNESIAAFGLHTGDFIDDGAALIGASRHSIAIGHEFLIGPWALHLKVGIYINRRSAFLVPRPFYFQLSPRYYFNSQNKARVKPFAGLVLKSHLFTAEYISFTVGMVFR